ncbi:MAG: hypothetical protein ACFB00_08625 [Parvularculaceae bacterium]
MTNDDTTAREIAAYAAAGRVWPTGEYVEDALGRLTAPAPTPLDRDVASARILADALALSKPALDPPDVAPQRGVAKSFEAAWRRLRGARAEPAPAPSAASAAPGSAADEEPRNLQQISGRTLRRAILGYIDPKKDDPEGLVERDEDFAGVREAGRVGSGVRLNAINFVYGVEVTGDLILSSMDVREPIYFVNCRFAGDVVLNDARFKLLFFSNCEAPHINLHRSTIETSLIVRNCRVARGLSLSFANFTCPVDIVDVACAPVKDPEAEHRAPSINLSGAVIDDRLLISDCLAPGGINAVAAKISGNLLMHDVSTAYDGPGADIPSPPVALNLAGASIEASAFIFNCRLTGGVNLEGVGCGASLIVVQVDADGLFDAGLVRTTNHCTFRACAARGGLKLNNAVIGIDLTIVDCAIAGVSPDDRTMEGFAVKLTNAQVGSEIEYRGNSVDGAVTFRNARAARLYDDACVLPGVAFERGEGERREKLSNALLTRVDLTNFVYGRLDSRSDDALWFRKHWLLSAPAGARHPVFTRDDFSPEPWLQLEQVLREMGRERRARAIAMSREWRRLFARRKPLPVANGFSPAEWAGHVISYVFGWARLVPEVVFYGLIAGFGYTPWRGVAIGVLTVMFAAMTFGAAERAAAFTPAEEEVILDIDRRAASACADVAGDAALRRCRLELLPTDYPTFQPAIYAIDVFLPVVELGQTKVWRPKRVPTADVRAAAPVIAWLGPDAFRHVKNAVVCAGWIITALTGLAFSGILQRRS